MAKKEKRTYADRAKYMIKSVDKRRKLIRKMAAEYKGDKCNICGYNKCSRVLEFHHIDPKEKDFGISSKGYTRSWEKVKNELDKCIMLCSNCHREVHEGVTQLPQVIEVEKQGEIGEAPMGNSEPNPILMGKV